MKQCFFIGVLVAITIFFPGMFFPVSAEESETEEKSCVLDASLKHDAAEVANKSLGRAEAQGISFTEEERQNLYEELYKLFRESLEPYYSIVKTPAECMTYFPSRELEDILREEPQRLCIHIETIKRETEKAIGELEKDSGFSFPEAEREKLKVRLVQRYVLDFLKRGIFLADNECPKRE